VSLLYIIVVLVVGWLVLSLAVALLWALFRSRLPHPDDFFDEREELPPRGRDVA